MRDSQLLNTTILLAGRPEAKEFFDEIKSIKADNLIVEEIELISFTEQDTREYVAQIAQDFLKESKHFEGPISEQKSDDTAEALQDILSDSDQVEVLYHYTGGKPVLLALFVDVLIESKKIPPELLVNVAVAKTKKENSEALAQIRSEIERAYVNLLFSKTGDLRSLILMELARARRGLDLDQLEFILGSAPGQDIDTWSGNPELRKEIQQELENHFYSLRNLSLVKPGPRHRLILQDELYRIFDKHRCQERSILQNEIEARTQTYKKLHAFAKKKIDDLKEEKAKFLAEDKNSLGWPSPAKALTDTFQYRGRTEEEKLIQLEADILDAQLERLHHKLRLDPYDAINDPFLIPDELRGQSGELDAELQAQIELWRFVQYSEGEYWHEFMDLSPDSWVKLKQVVEVDIATGWFSRFFITARYQRVIELFERLENLLATKSFYQSIDNRAINEPFFRFQRESWKEFSETYLSADNEENAKTFTNLIDRAKTLLVDYPAQNPLNLRPETVHIRQRRVIGMAYNNLGYTYVTLGRYREAREAYTWALRYLRDTDYPSAETTVRNNLSRVLSELGLINRAVRLCQDGLNLREGLGNVGPIAVSHSTLALIYNNAFQPENAWMEAAIAVAYWRKLENERGLGLALTHLSEALRRIATSDKAKSDEPEQLFETALEAINSAIEIFTGKPEIMRYIEAKIEQGCVYRDYMRYLKAQKYPQFENYEREALKSLRKALALAEEHNHPRHQLDAQVDLIWTYYYVRNDEAVEQTFKDCLQMITNDPKHDSRLLRKNEKPPSYKAAEPYIYHLLGRAWTVKGRQCMDTFQKHQKMAKLQGDKHLRDQAHARLAEAAEAFVQALGYSELYSVRAPFTSVIFNTLYDYLKGFNAAELRKFYQYEEEARKIYRIREIEHEDLTDMRVFLDQSFGEYDKSLPGEQEVG